MNRKLLALAIGAVMSLPLAAQAAPTVYGQLNLSVDMVDVESTGDDNFQVNSNSSRLGVMGEEVLGDGLSAVYKAEWAVSGDTAGANDLTGRDRYLGLKSNSLGTIKLGAFDSPLKTSQGAVDQFNDMTYLDMGSVIYGENRMNNLIGYESPKLADAITVKLALQPGETNADDGPAEAISAAVQYQTNDLYLAAAIDSEADSGNYNPVGGRDTIRLTGVFTMGALQLGGLVQSSELSSGGVDNQETSFLVSAAYTAGKNVFKGEVILSNEEDLSADDEETLLIALGMDHNFTQMTKVYGQVGLAQIDNAGGSGNDADDSILTVGMQTKF